VAFGRGYVGTGGVAGGDGWVKGITCDREAWGGVYVHGAFAPSVMSGKKRARGGEKVVKEKRGGGEG
jgi:hypothetical protein